MKSKIYESIIILNPVLSDDKAKSVSQEYINFLQKHEGKIRNEEHWGLKRLAYPIDKKQTGWYFLLEYSICPNIIIDFNIKLKIDERIIRFLTVKLDKYAIKYAKKRKQKRSTNNSKNLNT